MGGTSYSDAAYSSRMDDHKRAGTDSFVHDAAIRSGAVAAKVHEKLDPSIPNKAGKLIRESFDSDVHPESTAVVFGWDTTGSMGSVPRIFQSKMDKLMSILVKKGYLAHPHIMMAAYNDATTGSFAPLQVGQFEGGNEMDEALSLIVLEGGGGGHITESSELLMYYLARHTDIHCWTKRGKKGYVFLAGDELPYPTIRASHVKRLIGDNIQSDILTSKAFPITGDVKSLHGHEVAKAEGDILAELQERYEVFWIMPGGTSHENNSEVTDRLQAMFGQNFLRLPDANDVCELVASTIGLNEGFDLHDISRDLASVGADSGAISRATSALTKYAGTRSVAKGATASGALATTGSDDVGRL